MSRKFLIVAAVCFLIAVPRAVAADAKYVKLVNADSGKVLSVENDSTEAEARAVLAKDGDSESQQWKLEKDGDHYKLVNRKSGKVLDVYQESTEEDAPIIQWDDKADGNDNQRWSWVGDGKERRLKSKSSGLVLDVDKEGKIVQRKADDKAKSQLWQVVEVKK
jgi:hypothetical protein